MTKGPCPLESRPRDVTLCAVERSNENARSPLDFVSGYGTASTPFRARPTRGFFRRALVGTLERGIETGYASTAAASDSVRGDPPRSGGHAYIEPVASRPQASCQSSARSCTVSHWRGRIAKGEPPLPGSFPCFLPEQETGPSETNTPRQTPLCIVQLL